MVPEETQEHSDCLSKSSITQLDSLKMVVDSTNVPEVCDTVMTPASNSEAASTDLPLNIEEAMNGEETNMDLEFPEEFVYPFPDPASTLDIQGSARSDQGVQGISSPSSSSVLSQNISTAGESSPQVEHWTSSAASLGNSEDVHGDGVQPPNISYSGLMANALADTSPPNNPTGQSPQIRRFPSFSDISDYELEKLTREQGTLKRNFEETTLALTAELQRKMAEARSEYDKKLQEVDVEYNAQVKKEETYRSFVAMNSLLANAFKSKCTDTSAAAGTAAIRARSSQLSTHQQQAVQTSTHMNSTALPQASVTAAEAPVPNRSGPLSPSSRYIAIQPIPISQQVAVQSSTHSAAHPRPSVTVPDAPSPNLSGPLSPSRRYIAIQPRPTSQQVAVQSSTHSTAHPRRSVTVAEAPIPNCSGPLSPSPRSNMTQPSPISQQAGIQSNTHMMSSTAAPQPSVTALEAPISSLSIPISQQAAVQSSTHSTAHPRPTVTLADAPIPNLSGPVSPSPCSNTTQPSPTSQQAAKQSNSHKSSTAAPRHSVTAPDAPSPNLSGPVSPSPCSNTTQPSPTSQQTAKQSNSHKSSTAAPQSSVTSPEPPIPSFSGPLSDVPRCNTTQPRPVSQQAVVQSNTPVQSNKHVKSTSLPRPSKALTLHSPRTNTPQLRPPPVISNHTPSLYSSTSTPPVQGVVRAMAPHLRSSRPINSAGAFTTTHPTRLVQEQKQEEKSKGGLVYLSDDD